MAKIPFDIKFRPQIESGEFKVETRDGRPVRIVCWDAKRTFQDSICGFVWNGQDKSYFWQPNGSWWTNHMQSPNDLFLITPEPELSEFEEAVGCEIFDPPFNEEQIKLIKEESAKLFALAKKETEKGLPRWKKCAPCDEDKSPIPAWIVRFDAESAGESAVVHNGHFILFGELEKLPKEDEK